MGKVSRIFTLILVLVAAAGCQTVEQEESPIREAYDLLKVAPGLDAPGVREQIAWLKTPGAPTINLGNMIYIGSHPDIIVELADIYGPDYRHFDYNQRMYHDYNFDTPYTYGNAFQIAIAASRPELAEKLAIHFAKKAGDYREGLPLGAIPSVAAMASQPPRPNAPNFGYLSPDDSMWSDFYHDWNTIQRVNAQPPETYTSPPGRGLLFRYAATQKPGWRFNTIRQFGPLSEELKDRLVSPATVVDATERHDLSGPYEKELIEWGIKNVQFILKNFGGNVNETLPFCIMRNGEPAVVCPRMSPTHLAGRNSTMRDLIQKMEWYWIPAGKLQAFVLAGGDPNMKDSSGNSALAYARNGGVHPGANLPGDDFDIGQLLAGAAIVAGAGMIASEGGYDQATELMIGGLTDVIDGNPDNLLRMQQNALSQSQQSTGSSGSNSTTTATANATSETYSFTCPSGRTHSVPITASSAACRSAMQRYAKAAGCNMGDDLESAQNNYYSACASEM